MFSFSFVELDCDYTYYIYIYDAAVADRFKGRPIIMLIERPSLYFFMMLTGDYHSSSDSVLYVISLVRYSAVSSLILVKAEA